MCGIEARSRQVALVVGLGQGWGRRVCVCLFLFHPSTSSATSVRADSSVLLYRVTGGVSFIFPGMMLGSGGLKNMCS